MITDHQGPTRPGFGRFTTRSNAVRTVLIAFRFPATEYTLLEQSFKQDHALHQRTIFLSNSVKLHFGSSPLLKAGAVCFCKMRG